jgi:hypothetical protein
MTISLSAKQVGEEMRMGLMSAFVAQAKLKTDLKQEVPVRFSFQASNFSLPSNPNTEVAFD